MPVSRNLGVKRRTWNGLSGLSGILHSSLPTPNYFAEQGARGGIFVFDMQESSSVAAVVERFSFGLHAKIELFPVMTPDDLQKGLAEVPNIVEHYG